MLILFVLLRMPKRFVSLLSTYSHMCSNFITKERGSHATIGQHCMFVPGSNLLGTLEGVVVARNVRHDCTLIRLGGVDHICFSFERTFVLFFFLIKKKQKDVEDIGKNLVLHQKEIVVNFPSNLEPVDNSPIYAPFPRSLPIGNRRFHFFSFVFFFLPTSS